MKVEIPRAPIRSLGESVRAMARITSAWLPALTHAFTPVRT